jgi:mono/diheme cytochrome c family protein
MTSRIVLLAFAFLAGVQGSALSQTTAARDEPAALEFFEKKIRPLLVTNCYNCHSANTNSKGGLRVDDRNGMIHGGGRGPALVPGHPEKSLLIDAVKHSHKNVKMPPNKHLTAQEIADLTRWVKDGAAWPKIDAVELPNKYKLRYAKLRKEHWAFQPVLEAKVPAVKDQAWARDDIDRFVLAKVEEKDLQPVRDADRIALIRRVTFDLTGLPPTPAEIDAYLGDSAKPQAAFAKVVDRLLASSAFGERWGRHWLDIARYGESTGSARNLPLPHAWRYRDYVIDAFNSDKPYDQFIREQIAGDLLPAKSQKERDEQMIATGFLALGVKDVNQRFKVRFTMDNIDEQIDTVTRSVLALTASCARCHDHKFDPIPTTDYYALAGIFHSSDLCASLRNKMGGGGLDYYDPAMLLQLGSGMKEDTQQAAKIEKAKADLADARAFLTALVDDPRLAAAGPEREEKLKSARMQVVKLQNDLLALTDPAAHGPVSYGVRDGKVIGDTEIRVRGEAEKLGPTVPRGFLTIFDVPGAPSVNPKQSGRLELAQWLTHEKNPLTPRVMAYRVWKHLFGQGLVASVDNFGVTGDPPSHPELLDHLAIRLTKDGWSIKKLIRSIVLSRTYQLSSETTAQHVAVDPGNRLLWRHSPRRLDAEEIRDAMLTAAGTLNRARPKGSPAMDLKVTELTSTSALAKKIEEDGLKSVHRSVYLPLVRLLVPRSLEVFDFAEQGMVTGSRDNTTVAPQALYLLNDPFVRDQAKALAERVRQHRNLDEAERIALAYRMTLARVATTKEIERAQVYLGEYEAEIRGQQTIDAVTARSVAWTSFCQAILASAEFRYLK